MTTIRKVGRQTIRMFNGDHNPPHVHIVGGSVSLMVVLSSMKVIGQGADEAAEAIEWVMTNKNVLLAKWEEINA